MGGNLEFIEGNSKSKFGAFLRQNTKSAHRRACRSILFDFEFDFRYRLCSPELEMKTYVCTLVLPDGNKVVAKARADSLDDEVDVQWSGAIQRLGQIVLGRHSVGFLRWYLEARAQQLQGEFKFDCEDGSA
jgi:hypothetical protein